MVCVKEVGDTGGGLWSGHCALALIGMIILRSCCGEIVRVYVKARGGRWEGVVL